MEGGKEGKGGEGRRKEKRGREGKCVHTPNRRERNREIN